MPEFAFEEQSPAPDELLDLHQFAGRPGEFWPRCLRLMALHTNAAAAVLLLKQEDASWRAACTWPAHDANSDQVPPKTFVRQAAEMAPDCESAGTAVRALPSSPGANQPEQAISAVRLSSVAQAASAVVATLNGGTDNANEAVKRLQLLTTLPVLYQLNRTLQRTRADIEHLSSALDILVQLNEESHFLASALTLCNELATRCHCSRASLGWCEGAYVRLKAMSNTEKFERKTDAVQSLETTMEEAFDQDEDVVFPCLDEATHICRDHETYAQQQGSASICSVPLRLNGEPVGILTLERTESTFSAEDVKYLRLVADQVTRILSDLHDRDRWFGARLGSAIGSGCKKLAGPTHTGAKLLAVIVAVLLWSLVFLKMEYRIQAPFEIRSERVTFIPAPFNAYIDQVHRRVGDTVADGDVLLELDTRNLRLKRADALAQRNQHLRELEKARAEGLLPELRIAQAKLEGAQARLEEIDHHLSQAKLRAPQAGVLATHNDARKLTERVGSPVERGEVLAKIAALKNLYVEAKIDETDIEEIRANAPGQIAFASQPQQKFDILLESVEPAATTTENSNHFLARCTLEAPQKDWFRPGMTGVAKVNVGKRRLIWIFTHKTVDFLRMKLWW